MGGASRNEKKRRQDAASQRLAAAGIQVPPKKAPDRRTIIVAAVLAVALVAGLAVWYFRSGGSGASVTPTYTATQAGAVVTVGSGPVIVDVYEDYLCPICERFEERYGTDLTTALNNNQITVRYHSVAILDERTTPTGYSTRAANAALCSVAAGIFPAYHKQLFDSQPAEGSAGLTNDELIKLGADLSAQGDFATCVNDGSNANAIRAETEKAGSTPALQTDGKFGTPTVAIGGKKIDLNDSSWLEEATAG
jgi:protein-disulfide isomerase